MSDDEGSMALELTILAPALLILLALFLAYGRHEQAIGVLEGGARDAARAASQSHSAAEVDARVQAIAEDAFGRAPKSCFDSATRGGVPTSAALQLAKDSTPGTATDPTVFSTYTVTLSCSVTYNDLGWPLIPGSVTLTRSFASPVDPFVGTGP